MAYIGLQPQIKTVATSTQTLTGNGVDLEFSLDRAVSKAADVLVFVGNTVQVPETDYTATDNTLLFASGKEPANAAVISINYKAGALTTTFVSSNSYPVGSTVNPSIRSVSAASTGIYFPSTTSVGVTVAGNTRVRVTDSPSAVDTSTGALQVVGGVGITQNMVVGGAVSLVDSSSSSDTSTGALTVVGGVGVAENLNVGGDLNVAGDFTVAGQFTTTGSDSLAVNDPFIFLANANPGDNLDSGIVSSYNDGSDQRYTGIFRDITDGQYKLFDNLLAEPTTTVDTGNVSFRYANLELGAANVTSTVASTTSATGALKVLGGVGVAGAIYVNSNNLAVAIGNGGTNGTGNIGASGAAFNTVFARATSAQYADVAERYLADSNYEPGTVLHFGGSQEVSQCNVDHCVRVAGVVSTNPAYIMNDGLQGEHVVDVALLGRVPCQVQGPVSRGDMMVSAGNGRARAEANPKLGAVIGKALQDFNGDVGVIEVVVGRI